MQNDLIVFEFANQEGREVLLTPSVVVDIASQTSEILRRILELRDDYVDDEVELVLAAMERGSIKIGFKVLLGGRKQSRSKKIKLSLSTTGRTKINLAITGLVVVGIETGFFVPEQPASEPATDVIVSAHARALADKTVTLGIEELSRSILEAGADQVTIIVPDEPTCRIVDASTSPAYLGATGHSIPPNYVGEIEGELVLRADPIKVEHMGVAKEMYVGSITVTKPAGRPARPRGGSPAPASFTVLVEWESSRTAPPINDKPLPIQGSLGQINKATIKALEPIGPLHRNVGGHLRVTKRMLFE